MHDLRKKIWLESGKTVSRKARSRPDSVRSSAGGHSPTPSPGHSRAGSRNNSRPGSRYASEDEGGGGVASDSDYDDTMTLSTYSASDDAFDADERHGGAAGGLTWADRLRDRVAELQDRKRSSVQGREAALAAYLHLVRHHFAQRQLEASGVADVVGALLKSIRAGGSAEERALALRALDVTLLTCPSETAFGTLSDTLKAVCYDAEDEAVKAEALRALGVAVLYGGGTEAAYEEVLDFFLEVVESDGGVVDATDSGVVVRAALQAWALVASYVGDELADRGGWEPAMEAFLEQLDSTDVEVQTSAGSNIALLFEAARDREEEAGGGDGSADALQYDQHRVVTRMAELVRLPAAKSVSRRDRRHLRSSFASVVTSLEQGKGPGYSTAGRAGTNPHTGGQKNNEGVGGGGAGSTAGDGAFQEFGYREKIRVHDQQMVIDRWSLQARVEALKDLLGGGFAVHFLENPTVHEILGGAEVEYVPSGGARRRRRGDVEDSPRRKGRGALRSPEL